MIRIAVLFVVGALIAIPASVLAGQTWIPGWQPAATMTTPRAGAAVIAERGVVYAIGGIDGSDFLRSTEYSRVLPDGALTPWSATASLNEPRGFFAAVSDGNHIYVAGGGNGPNGHHLLRSVERARLRDDGSLGAWETERQQLNLPRRCSKLVITSRYIYALGGFGGVLLDSVERAEILPDGHLGAWQMLDDRLTLPRYVSADATSGSQVFVAGGHDEQGGTGIAAVEQATINNDGTLSAWRAVAPLITGRYGLSAAAWRGNLYALGGLAGAAYADTIELAAMGGTGSGEWHVTTPLPLPLANFGTVVLGDDIYVVGGTNRDGYYRRVYRASFNDQGAPGYYGSAAAAQQQEQQRQAQATTSLSALPYQGRVLEVVQTGAYTYVRIAADGGDLWLAGPHTDLAVGDRAQFSRGVEMANFHSRSLQREFAVIRFVERLEKRP